MKQNGEGKTTGISLLTKIGCLVGILTILGLLIALVALWQNPSISRAQPIPTELTATSLPTIAAVETNTPTLEGDSTDRSEVLSFRASDDSTSLNPVFGWQPGSGSANAYDLTLVPETLSLIAGPGTDQWGRRNTAPLITLPIDGNFDVSVKVKVSPVKNYQRAGIGVRSTQDVNTWVSISRNFHQVAGGQANIVLGNQQGNSALLNNIPYSPEECFFKIERRGSTLDLLYSENGADWVLLQDDYVADFTGAVEIFLMAASTTNQGITAQFSDFTLSRLP